MSCKVHGVASCVRMRIGYAWYNSETAHAMPCTCCGHTVLLVNMAANMDCSCTCLLLLALNCAP